MANAINLANVNISLDEFQRLSKGDYNAGEVKLAGETKLAKMNNHVSSWFSNSESISHAEVIAIKEALVRALSGANVAQDEIDKVRRELGLAPDGVADRTLAQRNVKPLTRQQIRDILDRNAATINEGRPANARIRTSSEIYGDGGMNAADRAKRDAVNAQLSDDHRKVFVNKDIQNFQRVVVGGGEYCDYETRQALRAIAEEQLEALLVTCKGHPRTDVSATATFRLPSGQTLTSPTGKSELEYASQLEDMIFRMKESGPDAEQRSVRKTFRSLATPEAKQAFFAALPDDPNGGYKARIAVVTILRSHGVVDHGALGVPNRLSDVDAIILAQHLASLQDDATAEALMGDPIFAAMAAKQPVRVANGSKAYVPHDTPEFFNRNISESFSNDKLLPTYRLLAAETAQIVRQRLGAKGVPDGISPASIVESSLASSMVAEAAGGGRVTVENLREPLLRAALRTAAFRVIQGEVTAHLATLGRDDDAIYEISKIIVKRNQAFVDDLMAAQTPADVSRIVASFKATVADAVRIFDELKEVRAGVEDRVRQGLANRLGMSPEALKDVQIELGGVAIKANMLRNNIGIGNPPLSTKAEFQKAFDDMADAFVAERMAILDAVDALDLPQGTKDDIKVMLLTVKKVKGIDIAFLAAEAKKIDASALEAELRVFAGKDNTESRSEIVIAGDLIVVTQTFGAFACKAGGQHRQDLVQFFLYPGQEVINISETKIVHTYLLGLYLFDRVHIVYKLDERISIRLNCLR